MPNFNEELGYPYGVFQGNHAPEILEDIETRGVNLTEQAFAKDVRKAIARAVRQWCTLPEDALDEMVDVFLEHYYAVVMIESDEDEYSFRNEKNHQGLYLTYLGGTPLVYVTESEWATWCRPCSPCVPGAGDLDSPMPEDDSVETALCMCPEDMQFLANANGETYYIFELDNPETVLFIEPQKEMEGELLR